MAYMSQEKKAKIVSAIKPVLKKYGLKGTFSVQNHSTICLNIKSGKIDFIENYNSSISESRPDRKAEKYIDVNPYWFQDHFSGIAKEVLTKIFTGMKSADWFDKSDAQIDYFHTAYYVSVKVGSWNKPYVVSQ